MVGCVRKLNNHQTSIRCRNYTNSNLKSFCDDTKHEDFDQLYSESCINSALDKFNRGMSRCIDKHAPVVKKRVKGRLCPWLSKEMKKPQGQTSSQITPDEKRS